MLTELESFIWQRRLTVLSHTELNGSSKSLNSKVSASDSQLTPTEGFVIVDIERRIRTKVIRLRHAQCVPVMERVNDLLRAAWLPPWQRHSLQVSWQPIQISVFLQIEAAWPIYGYVQSPDFTAATSSPP